ncbi:MAG TPA: peptide deformylase [Firmicutes bacterium]|nr:peptide deformylase [Bacillota bacterium]
MAVRMIRKDGDPILREKARDVKEVDDTITRLLDDMLETMEAARGVGLAAPQVGISKSIAVVKIDDEVYELINPVLLKAEGEEVDVEGCLSFPGLYGEVARATSIEVAFLNRKGEKVKIKASGFLARAMQHEMDHLNGVLFVDKVLKYVKE